MILVSLRPTVFQSDYHECSANGWANVISLLDAALIYGSATVLTFDTASAHGTGCWQAIRIKSGYSRFLRLLISANDCERPLRYPELYATAPAVTLVLDMHFRRDFAFAESY